MRRGYGYFGLIAAGGLLAATMMVGCGQQPAGTVEVAAPTDTHHWDDHETSAYARWEVEVKKPHVEFAVRQPAEQSDYWTWRKSHPDAPQH
jgi:hypothetical protein